MVNHERVEEAFEDAAAAGVRAFVVPGVGAEAGAAARPTTERLAARAREVGAALLGPNCMGVFVPGGPAAWNGRPQDTTAARPRRCPLPVGLDRRRVPLARRSDRAALRRVVRCRSGHRCRRLPRVLRRGSRDASGRTLPRDRAPSRTPSSTRCDAARKPTSRSCASRSAARRRRLGRRSPTPARSSAPTVRSRRCFDATRRSRSGTSTSSSRRSRSSEGAGGLEARASRGSPSPAASARSWRITPRRPASRSSRCRPTSRASLGAAFPNYLAPGNPLDAWGIADETEVYPRSLELLAASGEFDLLVAQADLSQFRDRTNDEWCELTLRTLARLADQRDGLFCAMTTVHSADPPRHFQELARELDIALLRGPRDAMLALATVARRRRSSTRRAAPTPRRLRPADCFGCAPRTRVVPRPRALRRALRGATSRSDAGRGSRCSRRDRRPGRGQARRPRAQGTGRRRRARRRTPEEAADAARRLGGPVLVARQVEPAPRSSAG